MPTPELIRAFISQASASGARSTALQPLAWLSGILTVGLVLAPSWNPPAWLLVFMAGLLGISVVIFLGSYIYFAAKQPDALRSEKFTLSKMAMEKNLIGDSRSGLLEVSEIEVSGKATALPNMKEGGKQ